MAVKWVFYDPEDPLRHLRSWHDFYRVEIEHRPPEVCRHRMTLTAPGCPVCRRIAGLVSAGECRWAGCAGLCRRHGQHDLRSALGPEPVCRTRPASPLGHVFVSLSADVLHDGGCGHAGCCVIKSRVAHRAATARYTRARRGAPSDPHFVIANKNYSSFGSLVGPWILYGVYHGIVL